MKALFLLMLFGFNPLLASETPQSESEWREIRPGVWVKHTSSVRYTIQKKDRGVLYFSVDKPCPPPLERYRLVYRWQGGDTLGRGGGCNGKVALTTTSEWNQNFHPLPPKLQSK